jgi:hypothetical protein
MDSFITLLCILVCCTSSLPATTYYVSPSGNDSTGNGTVGSPWRTIQFALDRVFPADILYLRGGVYNEQLISVRDGNAGGYVTIAGYGNEDVFIDGTGVVSGNNGAIITHSYLRFTGFTIRNWLHNAMEILNCQFIDLKRVNATSVMGGVHMTGSVHDFVLDSCVFYDYYGGDGGTGFDATPDSGMQIYNGVIKNCKAYLTTSAFGNCDGFGLGHDGVSNILLQNCETYGVGDGFDISGIGIRLERCSAHGCTYGGGYKLWRENVTLINCIAYDSRTNVELDFDWGTNTGVHARLVNCTIFGSTDAPDPVANVAIENCAGGSTLAMFNCILAGGENTGLNFDGDTIRFYTGDYNLFHMNAPLRAIATSQRDFSVEDIQNGVWTTFSGQDAHSRVVFGSDSLFIDTLRATPNLHLRSGSLAIDNGTNLPDAPTVDFDNCPRNVGPIDIGAYEYGACVTSSPFDGAIGRSGSYRLNQNYPNPFNPSTTFSFAVANLSFVTLRIYDILGREVSTLVNDVKPSGQYAFAWNATNMPSGIYFYRLSAIPLVGPGSYAETKKLVLLK